MVIGETGVDPLECWLDLGDNPSVVAGAEWAFFADF